MSTSGEGALEPEVDKPKRASWLKTNVRTLIVLIACCGVCLWAARRLWENADPVAVESRSIQDQAIRALKSGTAAERVAAIQELRTLRTGDSTAAIPPLIRALEDPETEVRAAAIDALASISEGLTKSRSAGEALRENATAVAGRLKDSNAQVHRDAIKALGMIGGVAVRTDSGEAVRISATALLECLKDPEPGRRAAAATALGQIAGPRLAQLSGSSIDRMKLLDALAQAVGDAEPGVRRAALKSSLFPFNSDPPKVLAEAIKDDMALNRAEAVRGLTYFRHGLDPWAPVLLGLAENDPDPAVRGQCLATLNFAFRPPAITAAIVPDLVASLKSRDVGIRNTAALVLSYFSSNAQAAIPELLQVLNEPLDPKVGFILNGGKPLDPACQAAWALGHVGAGSPKESEIITALIEVARTGAPGRRAWAAYGLGEFGPNAKEAIPNLIQLAGEATPDEHDERGAAAAGALGKIAPGTPSADKAVAVLIALLKSGNAFAQERAIEALRRFGPEAKPAVPALRELADTKSGVFHLEAARQALRDIEKPSEP